MVSKAQIDRIAARIEALRPRAVPFVAIRLRDDETEADAETRHYRERPNERGAMKTLFIERVIIDPAPEGGGEALPGGTLIRSNSSRQTAHYDDELAKPIGEHPFVLRTELPQFGKRVGVQTAGEARRLRSSFGMRVSSSKIATNPMTATN